MPVGFVFTAERLRQLHTSPQTPARTLAVRPARMERRIRSKDEWRVRAYWHEVRVLDGEGVPTGERRTFPAMATGTVEGERKRAVVTVVGWEDVSVYSDENLGRFRALNDADVLACGYRTLVGLRGAWRQDHPQLDLARLYSFMLGDRRDKTRFLTSTRSMIAGHVGDYTSSPAKSIDPDAPLLTSEYEDLAMHAHQRDAARRASLAATYSAGSLADRVAKLAR